MGHWELKCHSKPKKEQVHIMQDEEEALLTLTLSTLIRPEVISSSAEVEIHEEKVFADLDEEKERNAGTWVLDTGKTNYMSGCQVAFMKIDMAVLGTMCFGDDSVVRIEGRGIVVFECKNDKSQCFEGVYFIPHLTTNIISVDRLNEIGHKIGIDTGMMKIREPGGVLLVKVNWEVNRLYLLHLKFM
jgi:hypothetical protein